MYTGTCTCVQSQDGRTGHDAFYIYTTFVFLLFFFLFFPCAKCERRETSWIVCTSTLYGVHRDENGTAQYLYMTMYGVELACLLALLVLYSRCFQEWCEATHHPDPLYFLYSV